jgi:anti-sigma regulatory factor (Ser/Thr protein kinase)
MVVAGRTRDAVRLPPTPVSVRAARRAVTSVLEQWHLEDVAGTAALLVSELATNVLLHAHTDFEVRTERRSGSVRVTVVDASPRRPARRHYGLDAGTGRGLGLIATLSSSWGVDDAETPWCKGVWFELPERDDGSVELGEGALYGEDWLALVEDL